VTGDSTEAGDDHAPPGGSRARALFGQVGGASTGQSAATTRLRVRSELTPRDHPLPVPNGWYGLVGSAQLGDRTVVSIRAVGRDLVAFRADDGAARVLDAHCPHAGAHMGGGWIEGDRLACPYHGWEYGGDGRCRHIPYHDGRVPERAAVRSYPVIEQDGFVWFWYHAGDAAPGWDVDPVPEVSDPDWTDAVVYESELVAALQEMGENNVDYAHFNYVHRAGKIPLLSSTFRVDGPRSRVVEVLGGGTTFTRDACGPGIAVLRVPDTMTMIAATTPIDRGNCRLRWHFHFPNAMQSMADDLVETVIGDYGLAADRPIWEHKVWPERPVLVKADAAIAEFRRWYAQFYED
jgi:phenylpropionate dioxygenase-like ring-hydroxylating dioxygenase large terminal subunit